MILNIDTASSFVLYLVMPVFLLFGSIGIVYAMVLAFRRLTHI